ncbi:MAG TPA: hypothetical protein VKM55_18075 [Candidatus Lokiarchaeia archaeon]|nr:hypothetical protein [Candidatus Lokiarchaeia archaeon]
MNDIEYVTWLLGQPYNLVNWSRFQGELDVDKLRDAFDKIQARHPILTTTIVPGPTGDYPWLDSASVGKVPLTVIDDFDEKQDINDLVKKELNAISAMYDPDAGRIHVSHDPRITPPLIHAVVRRGQASTDLIVRVQHVIGDGTAMNYLMRDLLRFYNDPEMAIDQQDITIDESYYPTSGYHRRLSVRFMKVFYQFVKFAHDIQFRGKRSGIGIQDRSARITDGFLERILSPEETARFLARCKQQELSVHVMLCTAFSKYFKIIESSVDLRPLLVKSPGDSFNLLAGGTVLKWVYHPRDDFWKNARRYSHVLTAALRPRTLFRFAYITPGVIPVTFMRNFQRMLVDRTTLKRSFVISNCGTFDHFDVPQAAGRARLESFYCEVSNPLGGIVLVVYTIAGTMHVHVHFSKSVVSPKVIQKITDGAFNLIHDSLNES